MDKQPEQRPVPPQPALKKHPIMKEYVLDGKKVKVINFEELKRFATRLGKISQFYFIGAIAMFFAGVHFAQEGSVLLPKIFLGVLIFCLIMTLLSFRISYKVGKVVDLVSKNVGKK